MALPFCCHPSLFSFFCSPPTTLWRLLCMRSYLSTNDPSNIFHIKSLLNKWKKLYEINLYSKVMSWMENLRDLTIKLTFHLPLFYGAQNTWWSKCTQNIRGIYTVSVPQVSLSTGCRWQWGAANRFIPSHFCHYCHPLLWILYFTAKFSTMPPLWVPRVLVVFPVWCLLLTLLQWRWNF